MSLTEASLNSLLDDLNHLLTDEFTMLSHVREILTLQAELMNLKILMKELSEYNTHQSDSIDSILKHITLLISEAEDAIDSYLLHATDQKSRSYISRLWYWLSDRRNEYRGREQIASVANKVGRFNFDHPVNLRVEQSQESGETADQESKFGPIVDEDPIGFEEPNEQVVKLLTGKAEHFEVISIYGMAGLGKTALAKKVLKDPRLDCMIRAFVHVSREYDKKSVLLQILTCLTEIDDELRKKNEKELEKEVREKLKDGKYLLVLDDVWEPEDWDRFKDAFPTKDGARCRVLITTRNVKVAERANPTNPNSLYRLNLLPPGESRRLLQGRVFRNYDYDCPPELETYLKEIADKCDGLPLALVAVAGILLNDPLSVDWWRTIANNLKDYLATDATQTAQVMELIYKYLPNHLKPCFIYLGVFPQHFEIPVWKLVRLWISEGFIQEEPAGSDLESTAERHLEELIHRNLVMVEQMRSNGKTKNCRLTTLIHAFCQSRASDENVFKEMTKDEFKHSISLDHDRYRRLAINSADVVEDLSTGIPSGDSIRSFLTFTREPKTVDAEYVSCISKTFKLLKVLEAQSLVFSGFSPQLCRLVLLKYVAISSHISSLPSQFSALCSLQTLIVNTTSPTLQIKADIWNMPHFRHLHTTVPATLPYPSTRSEKSSQNVRTLSIISPECCKKEVFDRTPKLKKLAIGGELSELSMLKHLCGLESLQSLKLINSHRSCSLPSMENFLTQLIELTLKNTQLKWEEMSKLGELSKLEVLKLKQSAFCGDAWNTEKGCFPSLKHLHIGATNLVQWKVSGDHFPKLQSLKLCNCDKLEAFPPDFADIPSLKQVVLRCTNSGVATTARKLKEAKGRSIFRLSIYPPESGY